MNRRELILAAADDLVGALLYYDRKEDEELPRGEIEEALQSGEITPEEIVEPLLARLRAELSK